MSKNKAKRIILGLSALLTFGSMSVREIKYKAFNPSILENNSNNVKMAYVNENYYDDVIVPYQNKINIAIESINKFSNVFGLKESEVYNIIKENNDILKLDNILTVDKTDLQRELLLNVIDIKKHPGDYNVELCDISSDDEYKKAMTIRETVNFYSTLLDVKEHAKKILAIECWESGYYLKPIATSYNNPGALNGKTDSLRFSNLEEGIVNHIMTLKYNYFDKGRDTFAKIEKIYTEDKGHWLSCVTSIYNQIENDEIVLYDEKEMILTKK